MSSTIIRYSEQKWERCYELYISLSNHCSVLLYWDTEMSKHKIDLSGKYMWLQGLMWNVQFTRFDHQMQIAVLNFELITQNNTKASCESQTAWEALWQPVLMDDLTCAGNNSEAAMQTHRGPQTQSQRGEMLNNMTDMIHCTLMAHQATMCMCALDVVCCVCAPRCNRCVWTRRGKNSSLQRADKCSGCALFIRTGSLFAVCLFFAESTQRR